MKKFLLVIILVSAFLTSIAQAPGTGAYGHAPLDNRGFDQVNVGNLNVRFSVPIVSRQGRGIGFDYAIHYEGLIWSQVTAGSTTTWTHSPDWGFSGILNDVSFSGYLTYRDFHSTCPGPSGNHGGYDDTLGAFVYHDPFGGVHSFDYSIDLHDCPDDDETHEPEIFGDGGSSDGSGYTLLDPSRVRSGNGTIIQPGYSATGASATSITDTNGNKITSTGSVMTDTLGAAALTIGGSVANGITFTYPVTRQASSATSASVVVHYQTYTVRTNFGVSGVTEFGATTVSLPHDVTYPDNPSNKFIFDYEPTPGGLTGEVTGRLRSVQLPTGGVITYDYSGGSINSDGTPSKLVRTGGDGSRTYTRGSNAYGPTTLLTDNASNDTLFQLITDATQSALFYSADRTSYSGGVGSGTVLAESHYCFNGAAPATASTNCDGQTLTLPITNIVSRSSLNGGSVATISEQYDIYGQLLTAFTNAIGNTTTYTYNANGRLASSQTVDPAGHTLSQNNNYFDETAPIATSSIPQHGGPSGTRGNLTRSTAMVDGSTNLETKYTYYDTGALATSTATTTAGTATAGTTSYTYDATQGFVTGVSFPAVPSGASLSTSTSVDATSAAVLSSTGMDPGDSTSIDTYDPIMRPLKVTPAVPLKPITLTYSPNSVVIHRQLDATGSTLTHEETILDGFGRTIRTIQKATVAGTWYIRDFCYDTNGNLVARSPAYSSSTAYPSSLACTSSPRTTYSYDALNRLHLVTYPDGSTKQIDIWSRAVRVTQDGVSRITQKDEAGRITDVCEVSTTSYGTDSPATCHLDIADTGYITTYRYDDPTHTVNIEQGNTTPGYKLRSFQTDAIGRTINAVEPEVGTTQYFYTYNGIGLQVTRRKPLQFNSSTGTATTAGSTTKTDTDTQYDVLGRPVSITYHDGYTYNKHYYYDASPAALGWTVSGTHTAGRLVDAVTTYSSSFAASHYGYYESGLMASMAQCTSNICGTANQQSRGTSSYSYDGAGRLATAFDLATGSIGYTRNLAGQTEGVANFSYDLAGGYGTSTLVSSVVNTPFGPTSYTLGNGRAYSQTYDSSGRMNMQTVCGSPSNCGTLLDRWLVNYSGRRVTSHCQIRSSPTFAARCGRTVMTISAA